MFLGKGPLSVTLALAGAAVSCAWAAEPRPATRESAPATATAGQQQQALSFEINQGQADSRVKFLSRGRGYSLFLTANEAVLKLQKRGVGAALRMKLLGANPAPQVRGLRELVGKSNYFMGNDPAKWRTNIANYAAVQYRQVYPGIDLVYYGNPAQAGQLEYDFVVAPGADPRAIRLAFQGARRLRRNAGGDLRLETGGGEIVYRRPRIYQQVNGRRAEIAGGYLLEGRLVTRFVVGGAVFPAAIQNANSIKGQGGEGAVVGGSS